MRNGSVKGSGRPRKGSVAGSGRPKKGIVTPIVGGAGGEAKRGGLWAELEPADTCRPSRRAPSGLSEEDIRR